MEFIFYMLFEILFETTGCAIRWLMHRLKGEKVNFSELLGDNSFFRDRLVGGFIWATIIISICILILIE